MKTMKNVFLVAGMALTALTACAGSKTTKLTVSGLNPAKFVSTISGKKNSVVYHCQ
jgi:aldose 1-epimerase